MTRPASTESPIVLERKKLLGNEMIGYEFSNRGGRTVTIEVPANPLGQTDMEDHARAQAAKRLWSSE